MLGWITGQSEEQKRAAGASTTMEPPQTPGPVFAMRAFKSAIWGTPAADDTIINHGRPVSGGSPERPTIRKERTVHQSNMDAPIQLPAFDKPVVDSTTQLGTSPTKSILVTPGTVSTRRKTVSFGEAAVQGKLEQTKTLFKSNNSVLSSAGLVSSQWMSSQSDTKSRPPSRLTQSLLDAKEQSLEKALAKQNDYQSTVDSVRDAELLERFEAISSQKQDLTIDLQEPQSQSGKYWKAEFENYRKRTNIEISRLIQYRSSAKSYARKKDIEAMRLRDELRREEEKVAEMESRVTKLASSMMNEQIDDEREKVVQDLARQTALAVQYKHKVDTLRKTLERHGVIGSPDEQTDFEQLSGDKEKEVNRLKEALEEANKRLEDKSQDNEIKRLKDLAESSQRKISDLTAENLALKRTITRFKEAMGKYEERRTEKEGKLKDRMARLDLRYQHSKEKMKIYRAAVDEERNMYREEIEALQAKIAALTPTKTRVASSEARRRLNEKSYAGVQIHDFGDINDENNAQDTAEEEEEMSHIIQSIEVLDIPEASD